MLFLTINKFIKKVSNQRLLYDDVFEVSYNGQVSFQRLFGGFQSQLDPILEKADCSLEQILDEDVLLELKNNGATKFGAFMTKNAYNFESMLEYILSQNEVLINQKKQIRYPFMLSEVFNSENSALIDYFFEADKNVADWEKYEEIRKTFLPKLFLFLEADFLNLTGAGYFAKVLIAIIRKRGYDIWEYINANKGIISNLIKHLDVFHIADCIEKLIILDTSQDQQNLDYFYERQTLLSRVINYLANKTHQSEVVDNCCYILNEVCTKSEYFFETLNCPEKLFSIALNAASSSVINFIITLCEQIQRYIKQEEEKNNIIEFDPSKYYSICNELPRALAADKIHLSSFQTTYGVMQNPFSQVKLKLIQLLFTILKINNPLLIQSINITEIYKLLLKYILKYEFNNQLQNLFYDITYYIFNTESCQQYQQDLIQIGLFTFLTQYNKYDKKKVGTLTNPIRAGYFGVLSKLSYALESKAQNIPEWSEYQTNVLDPLKKIELVFMFGINPNPKQQQYFEEENSDEGMKQILARIEQHKQLQNQLEKDEGQGTVEIEQEEEEEGEEQEQEQDIEQENTKPIPNKMGLTLNQQDLEVKIQEVILSPKTSPKDVQEIIQFQEKAMSKSPQEIENKSDQTVNRYWKAHDYETDGAKRKASGEIENNKRDQQIEENLPDTEEIEEDIHTESTEQQQQQQQQQQLQQADEKENEQIQEPEQEQEQQVKQKEQEEVLQDVAQQIPIEQVVAEHVVVPEQVDEKVEEVHEAQKDAEGKE